jgi:hypothetical protein
MSLIAFLLFGYRSCFMFNAVWESRMPKGLSIWGKDESGRPMRREQRLLFCFGGLIQLYLSLDSFLRLYHILYP